MSDHLACHEGKCYSVPELWEVSKDLSIEEWDIDKFNDHLYKDHWYSFRDSQGNDMVQIPNFSSMLNHFKRVMDADLAYPILVYNGKILDGVHRLMKLHLLGRKTALVRILDEVLK